MLLPILMGTLAGLAWFAQKGAAIDPPRDLFANHPRVLEIEVSHESLQFMADHITRPVAVALKVGAQVWSDRQARLRIVEPAYRGQGRPEFLLEIGDFDAGQGCPTFALHLEPASKDGSYLEQFCGAKLAELCQLPCLRIGHAKIFVNSRDYGLHVLKEGVSRDWLQSHFGHHEGTVLNGAGQDIDAALEIEFNGTAAKTELLEDLVLACSVADLEARNRRLGEILDLDAFVRFMALESIYRHGSGYCEAIQNYKLYLDPQTNKALFIPDGFGQGFIGPGFPILNAKLGLVARAVMQIPSQQAAYLKAVSWIASHEQFQNSLALALTERSRTLDSMLGGPTERNRLQMRTPLLIGRLNARFAAVRTQLEQFSPFDESTLKKHEMPGLRMRQAGQTSDLPVRSPIDYGAKFRDHYHGTEALVSSQPVQIYDLRLSAPKGMLEGLTWRATNWVTVEVHIQGRRYDKTGLRLKGHGTRRDFQGKASFTLKFNKEIKGRKFLGQSKIHLHNALYDPAYLNEFTGAWLFHRAGYPAPEVNYAHLHVNNQDYGLYVVVEGTTQSFLNRAFGHDHGLLYEGGFGDLDTPLDLDNGKPAEDDPGPLTLYQAGRKALRLGRLEPLQEVCDIEKLAAFVSLEVILGHHDGYSLGTHNFRLYRDTPTTPFLFLPHGMDVLFFNSDTGVIPAMKGVMALAVTEIPDGRAVYLRQCREVLARALDLERYAQDAAFVCRLLQPVLRASEPLKAARQLESAQHLASVLGDRKAYLMADLARLQRPARNEPGRH